MTEQKQRLVVDVECYRDYFLVVCLLPASGKSVSFELSDTCLFDGQKLSRLLCKYTAVTFNGNAYDMPMITAACSGKYNNSMLKALSDSLITSGMPAWRIMRERSLRVPDRWDHIDLIEVAPGQASLKIYGGRMHAPKLQDLPLDPSASIAPSQYALMREYCLNDCETTALLLAKLEKQIALRVAMGEQYGMDLRSKSDAQIAETVIKSELENLTGETYQRPQIAPGTAYRYKLPDFIAYKTPGLQALLADVLAADFVVADSGAVIMPDTLAGRQVTINGTTYSLGIGGLHSCESSAAHIADAETLLCDLDFASYYPFIIIGQSLYPQHLGRPFLDVYKSIVYRRIAAKRAKDTVTADSLKLSVNGSFGKLGSKYSVIYSPDLMIQTTISGQLTLLMLIESLELSGIHVVSANTDGIVVKTAKQNEDLMHQCVFDLEINTGFEMEQTNYRAIYSESVNNYVALKASGGVKGKGVYAMPTLMKNPAGAVCVQAVYDYLEHGTPVEDTINGCDDMRQFAHLRQVKGGATKDSEAIGKSVRWYYSTCTSSPLLYAKNGNKVPKSEGAMPMMQLLDQCPADLDREYYIKEAKACLVKLGAITKKQKQKELFK